MLRCGVATTLQIRSIDPALADAARAEAARRHLTLSDYLKDLIAKDLQGRSAADRRRALYAELKDAPRPARLTSADVLAALDEVRREMGTA